MEQSKTRGTSGDLSITNGSSVGGMVGMLTRSTIKRCYSAGKISGQEIWSWAHPAIGNIKEECLIENCLFLNTNKLEYHNENHINEDLYGGLIGCNDLNEELGILGNEFVISDNYPKLRWED